MLVLSRKVGESIEIGSDITLIVTRISGGRIQIGIDAPREVAVRRAELLSGPRFNTVDLQFDATDNEHH